MIRFLGLLPAPDVAFPYQLLLLLLHDTSASTSFRPPFSPATLPSDNTKLVDHNTHTHTFNIYATLFNRVILNTTRHPCRIPSSRFCNTARGVHTARWVSQSASLDQEQYHWASTANGGSVKGSRLRAVGRTQHANAPSAVQNTVCKSPAYSLLAATSSLPPFLSFVRHASYPLLRYQLRSSRVCARPPTFIPLLLLGF
jgi:hypothetical protein